MWKGTRLRMFWRLREDEGRFLRAIHVSRLGELLSQNLRILPGLLCPFPDKSLALQLHKLRDAWPNALTGG